MSRRGVPDRQVWPEMDNSVFIYLESLKDAPAVSDLSPLESISGTSTAAEIGAAIAAYVAKVKG